MRAHALRAAEGPDLVLGADEVEDGAVFMLQHLPHARGKEKERKGTQCEAQRRVSQLLLYLPLRCGQKARTRSEAGAARPRYLEGDGVVPDVPHVAEGLVQGVLHIEQLCRVFLEKVAVHPDLLLAQNF